jgi:hypothetical protein
MDQLQARPAPERDAGDDPRLAKLSGTLKGLRDEAIKGRADSGIETIWTEDQEYYDGIDDANRAEKLIKPVSTSGTVTRQKKPKKGTRSTVFLNITARYVNAAAAYVADKLFRSDVSNYGMRPTPKPSLIKQLKDKSPAMDEQGQPVEMPVLDEQGDAQMAPHIVNGQPMMDQATGQPVMLPVTKPVTVADIAKQAMDSAKESADKAKTQIDDWLTECGINGQSRQIVNDGARIGTGVLKGPFPEMMKSRAVLESKQGVQLVIEEKLVPKSRRISVWNLWPDPSCGTDIHRGKFIFEDDEINSRLLGELKNDETYIASAIDRVLEEGPKHAITGSSKRARTWNKGNNELFQIWYFHGYLSADDLECCGYEFEQEAPQEEDQGIIGAELDDAMPVWGKVWPGDEDAAEPEQEPAKQERKEQYPCIVVMVNDTVIKATVSPFDSGQFPYRLFRWEYRDDHWAGRGVARQMRTSQDGVNAGVRMMHDNAGVSGAPILIFDRSRIEPADGVWSVGPHKIYYTKDNDGGGNIRDAITWVITPSMQAPLMEIIRFWMHSAEEETGMPMLLQGQQGDIEHTLGEARMLNNNGSALLRRVTNIYDDDVTKPHISAYYEWLLIHGEDDSMKGDFTIDALGSSVLIERDAHSQILQQMLGLSINPAFGADPELVYREFLLSQRFDAERLMLTDEKKAEMAKRQPPEDPRITAAKINAQVQGGKTEAENQRKGAELAMEKEQRELDRELEHWQTQIQATLDAAQLDGDRFMNADELRASIAQTTAKLRTQIALARRPQGGPQVMAPPMEPVGRAPNGEAFAK